MHYSAPAFPLIGVYSSGVGLNADGSLRASLGWSPSCLQTLVHQAKEAIWEQTWEADEEIVHLYHGWRRRSIWLWAHGTETRETRWKSSKEWEVGPGEFLSQGLSIVTFHTGQAALAWAARTLLVIPGWSRHACWLFMFICTRMERNSSRSLFKTGIIQGVSLAPLQTTQVWLRPWRILIRCQRLL